MSPWGPVSNREAFALIFLVCCFYVAIGVISTTLQERDITPYTVATWPLNDGTTE